MPLPSEQILNDEQIAVDISKGNDQAFNQLFRSYFQSIALYAYTIVKETPAAEDIAQETFVKLWKGRTRLGEVRNLKGYLYKIAYNESMNWISKQMTKPSVALDDSYEQIASDIDISKNVIMAETIRQLHKMIDLLSPRVKKVFQLYYLEGKSTEEISQLLKTSVKTVMNQRKSGLRIIRERLFPS